MLCGRSTASPSPPAPSLCCASTSPTTPQMSTSASQSPARMVGPAGTSLGPSLATVPRVLWGPSARQVGTWPSRGSGRLDRGHQDGHQARWLVAVFGILTLSRSPQALVACCASLPVVLGAELKLLQ